MEEEEEEGDTLICFHCKELPYQPVTLACGRTYCHSCVDALHDTYTACAMCGREIIKPKKWRSGCFSLT